MSGHDFSRAECCAKSVWGFSPCGSFPHGQPQVPTFSAAYLTPEGFALTDQTIYETRSLQLAALCDEGAPGPSLLGTGDRNQSTDPRRLKTTIILHVWNL